MQYVTEGNRFHVGRQCFRGEKTVKGVMIWLTSISLNGSPVHVDVRGLATTGNVQILKLHQRNFRNKRHSMFQKTCNQASIFDGFAPLIRLCNIKLFQALRAKI